MLIISHWHMNCHSWQSPSRYPPFHPMVIIVPSHTKDGEGLRLSSQSRIATLLILSHSPLPSVSRCNLVFPGMSPARSHSLAPSPTEVGSPTSTLAPSSHQSNPGGRVVNKLFNPLPKRTVQPSATADQLILRITAVEPELFFKPRKVEAEWMMGSKKPQSDVLSIPSEWTQSHMLDLSEKIRTNIEGHMRTEDRRLIGRAPAWKRLARARRSMLSDFQGEASLNEILVLTETEMSRFAGPQPTPGVSKFEKGGWTTEYEDKDEASYRFTPVDFALVPKSTESAHDEEQDTVRGTSSRFASAPSTLQ
jgi:hypothetical protein